MGHGSWPKARETFLATEKRIQKPFESRQGLKRKNASGNSLWMLLVAGVIVLLAVLVIFIVQTKL